MGTPEEIYQQVAEGGAILRKLLGGCFIILIVLVGIIGAIQMITRGYKWVSTYSKESSIPYDKINIEAKGELGGGENGWGWTIYYVIHNDSSNSVDLTLNAKLPVTFSNCQAAGVDPTIVNFQALSYQPVVVQVSIPPNQSVSGTAYATYAEDSGRTNGYFTCWQTAGCDSYYGCQQFEIGTPIFIGPRETSSPVELSVERLP